MEDKPKGNFEYDSEKRKNDKPKRDSGRRDDEGLASRQIGCFLSIVGIIASVLIVATPLGNSGRASLPLLLCMLLIPIGLSITLSYTHFQYSDGATRPTLNQIRQHPDDPLIVQQWNGRGWVEALNMRTAAQSENEKR